MTESPALWQFLGAYLHQDWPEVHGTVEQALEDFISEDPALARGLPSEVAALLASEPSEAELEQRMNDLGSCYVPAREEGGYRGWLEEISRRVRASTQAP